MSLPYDFEQAVRTLSQNDRKLGELIDAVGHVPVHYREMDDLFGALCESITYQQLSGKAAATIFSRFTDLIPDQQDLRPESVLALSVENMRSAGLSRAKTAAIRDLAEKIADGTVPGVAVLRQLSDEEVVRRLTVVRGIGPWTAEMLLIFRLGRPDILPASDLGVRKGFQLVYETGELPTATEVREYGERWKPWRSVASWYFYRALELETPLSRSSR